MSRSLFHQPLLHHHGMRLIQTLIFRASVMAPGESQGEEIRHGAGEFSALPRRMGQREPLRFWPFTIVCIAARSRHSRLTGQRPSRTRHDARRESK